MPVTKATTREDGKGRQQSATRKAMRQWQSSDEEAKTKGEATTKGRTKKNKSNHVASCFGRGVARTFEVVQFYDQGLIFPSRI